MEDTNIEKAIYAAINKIRKVWRHRPHADNIVAVAAKKTGLAAVTIRKNLDFLVESGAVYVSTTDTGEDSYFIFNPAKFDRNTDFLGSFSSKDDSNASPDATMDASKNFSFSTPNPKDCIERSDFIVFLDLVNKLTDDIRDLNKTINGLREKNELLAQEKFNLILENEILKATKALDPQPSSPSVLSQGAAPKEMKRKEKIIEKDVDANNTKIVYESIELDNSSIIPENKKNHTNRPSKKKRQKIQAKQKANANVTTAQNKNIDKPNENIDSSKQSEAQKAEKPESEEQADTPVAGEKNEASKSQKSGSCDANQQRKKRSTYIVGDSMVKDVKGWELKKSCDENENIFVKPFSGSTVKDMNSYCQPVIDRAPDQILLHVGTNDLSNKQKSDVNIAQDIIDLAKRIKSHHINVVVSGLVPRYDGYEPKRVRVNYILRDLCSEHKFKYCEHSNIDASSHLNRSKVHLNKAGVSIFANNLFEATRPTTH